MASLVYLISSIPALNFDQDPPISMDEFLADAQREVSKKQFQRLEKLDLQHISEIKVKGKLRKFVDSITDLNADIAEIRDAKEQERNPGLTTLTSVFMEKDPLQREKYLMQWQWDELTDIEVDQYFTFAKVLIYKLKLQILIRLQSFDQQKGVKKLNSIIDPTKRKE